VLSLVVLETASSANLTDDALLDAPPKVLLVLAFPMMLASAKAAATSF